MYQGYDGSPQINFTGSNIPGMPTVLDQVNPGYYNQIAQFIASRPGARLASFSGLVLYDTLRIDAGVLPSRDFTFFTNPVNSQQGLFVAGTQYTKQDIDVHQWVTTGGQLSQGYEALVWEIGVQFHVVASLDNSVQGSGNFINLPLDPGTAATIAATDAVLSANVMRAFQESLFFSFFINQTNFELGPGWRFPAGCYGISGYNALAHSTAQIALGVFNDGAANNGFGWAYQMPVMRHIPHLTKFGIKMSVQNPFTTLLTGPVRVVVTLGGIGVQPVTG
jgi:hypothetical protein